MAEHGCEKGVKRGQRHTEPAPQEELRLMKTEPLGTLLESNIDPTKRRFQLILDSLCACIRQGHGVSFQRCSWWSVHSWSGNEWLADDACYLGGS